MPFIDTVVSQQSTSVGGIDVYANPRQFGSQIGEAVQDLGGAITQVTNAYQQRKNQQDAEGRDLAHANNMANANMEMTRIDAEARNSAPEDGSGVFQNVLEQQRKYIDDAANKIDDPVLRAEFRKQMAGSVVPYAQNNIEFEASKKAEFEATRTDLNLRGMENTVRSNAQLYDQSLTDGNAIIDGNKNVPASAKPAMRREWGERLAFARFQGLLDNAKSVEDYDAIEADIKKDVWQKAFKPSNYSGVLGELAGARKTFLTQQTQTARALIDSANEQVRTGKAPIATGRLEEIVAEAEKSQNPTIIRNAYRLQRDNQILVEGNKLPAKELEARSNGITGAGYPGMPDEVNKSINSAVTTFPGVPAAFFAGTAQLEYGQYLRPTKRGGNPKFAPRAVHKGVDIRNIKPETANAVTLAGEIFGEPLNVTSAFRSQGKQNALRFAKGKNPYRATIAKESQHTHGEAVDISTAGMSGAQKAKLFDSLVQAGFTAFGDYGGYIHADMREAAPNSFNPQTGWLGWTKTTPEVIAALTARGYAAGKKGSALTRGDATKPRGEPIDYGKGTTNGSTTAEGLFQFTKDTWLETVKNTSVAQRIGLPANLTDAQLLDLRKDQYWSTMAAGANAEQNQKILEKTLGRTVNAPELYMAHFLGAGGAQTLFSAYQNNPDANASELMPQAAKNNPGRFKDKGGRELSVKEVYDNITVAFSTEPSQVQYEDAEMYKRMATGRREAERNQPMDTYNQHVAPINDLQQPGGFASRSAFVLSAADMYDLPVTETKPFTTDEADTFKQIASDGALREKLNLMRNISEMDNAAPGSGAAAYKQLGLEDTVMQYAAETAQRGGDTAMAETIMRGQERLRPVDGNANAFHKMVFGDEQDALGVFSSTVGRAFDAMPPGAYDAAYKAAKAYYAEKHGSGGFDQGQFKDAVYQVTGQSRGMVDINGEPTIVPPNVDPLDFDRVVENLTDADVIEFSENDLPPIDIHGDPVGAEEMVSQGRFVYVGDNLYKVEMGTDGTFLVTAERDGRGYFAPYLFNAKPELIKQKASVPIPPRVSDGTPTEPPSFVRDADDPNAIPNDLSLPIEQRRKMFE